MKKLAFLALGLFLLASCSKNTDLYDPNAPKPDTPSTPTEKEVTPEDIQANVQKVFGTTFDPNHDWNSTSTGEVTINANSSIKKVQVMAFTKAYDEEGEEITNLNVMNQAELNGKTTVKLTYDAPKDNMGIYVAFISANDYQLRKVEGNTVSLDGKATTRAEKGLSQEYTYPTLEGLELEEVTSYAKDRKWNLNDKLYQLKDENEYQRLKMAVTDYSPELKDLFNTMVFSYFPNSKTINNLPLVKATGYYNETGYPITTGNGPIIVSPVYKRDGAPKYGSEVYNSDLYYYYFKETDSGYISDPTAYLMSLPKYKAFPFSVCYNSSEDDVTGKRGAFALIYWGPEGPTYQFPAGYKIGFMIRAKTTADNRKKQGELYLDGRLNNDINKWGNFSTLGYKLGVDGARAGWLTLNNRQLLCWESGTDTDFNDVILDIEGGVEEIVVFPETNYTSYMYCFEDQELGDYDLNDVVIKANRTSDTTVEYSIVACGAYDELYIMGIGIDNKEVHSLFGKGQETYINTDASAEQLTPQNVTRTVDSNFSLLDPKTQPYIFNKTTGKSIYMSKIGEEPHGIMIPFDFKYPLEKVCIKDAYTDFNNWGKNLINSTDWFKHPVNENVYNK